MLAACLLWKAFFVFLSILDLPPLLCCCGLEVGEKNRGELRAGE